MSYDNPRTELGSSLKKTKSTTLGNNLKSKNKIKGLIVDVKGSETNEAEYIVKLIYPNGTKTGWIPLSKDPGFLSQNYGSPQDLVNTTWCEVEYEGSSPERGFAEICSEKVRNAETISKCNELGIQGTAFAPPGSGLI